MYIHEGAGGGGEVSSAHEAGKLLSNLGPEKWGGRLRVAILPMWRQPQTPLGVF